VRPSDVSVQSLPMVSADLIRAVCPRCVSPQQWADALNLALERYEITTKARVSSFLAQTAFESSQFNRLIENLSYKTPQRLMSVWPKRFPTEASAMPYVGNEEKLANFVYANRLGNGDADSGDGFRYRGRGIIQMTGRTNYEVAGMELGLDLIADPDLLLQLPHAAMSATWFWRNHGLNALADDETDDSDLEDFTEITKRINGGTVGLKDRLAMLNQVETMLA
jgi:putative chitinase